eukprot:2863669-Amphidinium_carterae.1
MISGTSSPSTASSATSTLTSTLSSTSTSHSGRALKNAAGDDAYADAHPGGETALWQFQLRFGEGICQDGHPTTASRARGLFTPGTVWYVKSRAARHLQACDSCFSSLDRSPLGRLGL